MISDDKVEENHLATAFDVTCRAWEVSALILLKRMPSLSQTQQKRFNIPYTHCGCPRPGDKLGRRFVQMARWLSSAFATNETANNGISVHSLQGVLVRFNSPLWSVEFGPVDLLLLA